MIMKNLKKLIYQYKFLKLELDDRKDEHSELSTEFESLFSDIIPKPDFNEEEIVKEALSKETVEKKPQPEIDDKVKKIYKDVAKKLHPDKGGDESTFKELNDRYKANDLLGVVELATENNVEFDISEEDEAHLIDTITQMNKKIEHYKTTLAYVWKYGNQMQRYGVLQTLAQHLGKKIDIEELNEDIRNMLK